MPAIADKKPRSLTLDAIRGWAIILVVLGHAITNSTPGFDSHYEFRLIYSFHMPLLMAVSGYLAYGRIEGKLRGVIAKKALQLVVPFAVWGLLAFATYGSHRLADLPSYVVKLIESPDRGLWFLWVLYFEFVALSLVTTIARRHTLIAVVALIIIVPILPAPSRFGIWDMTMYFPCFAGGWLVRQNGQIRGLFDHPWFGPLCATVFLAAAWFWSRTTLPEWLPFTPGVAQNVVWKSYKYFTSVMGIATSTWLVLLSLRARNWIGSALAWVGRRTIDVYGAEGYIRTPLLSLLPPLGLPWGALLAAYFVVPLAGSLAASVLVLRRFSITRRLLLGDWSSAPGGRLGGGANGGASDHVPATQVAG